MIPVTTFNMCNVCGKPIEKDDYCYADNIHQAKTGHTYTQGYKRLVFKQHHLKCNNPNAKTLW